MATINGTDGPDSIVGTDGDDQIFGFSGNDTIYSGIGNDTIDGGPGGDLMAGGGRTTFLVDDVGDIASSSGYGIVIASVSWVARAKVDEIRAASGRDPINLTGTADYQLIVGNDGDNVLNSLSTVSRSGQPATTGDS